MRLLTSIRKRPLALIFALIGVVLVMGAIRAEDTRKNQGVLQDRVIRVEADSPCTKLTTRECAIKLTGALSEKDRRKFVGGPIKVEVRREIARINRRQRSRILEELNRTSPQIPGQSDPDVVVPGARTKRPTRRPTPSSSPAGPDPQQSAPSAPSAPSPSPSPQASPMPSPLLPPLPPLPPLPGVPCVNIPGSGCLLGITGSPWLVR